MDNNFLNYLTKQISKEDFEIWLNMNNIIVEKIELYYDFCTSLLIKIETTYLGDSDDVETKIEMSEEDKKKHFKWCWEKTVEDFEKENITFNKEGEHFDYFEDFYNELFYKQNDDKIKKSIRTFFKDVFDTQKVFTQSDLDIVLTIYRTLDKNMSLNVY
jgi:hypothetical protein